MKSVAAQVVNELENSRSKELQKFGITDQAIAELGEKYLKLTVKGIEDKDGLASVHSARMDVVRKRTGIEAIRKELKEESLNWGRRVDAEAKRITGLLQPIEEHLDTEEKKVTEEIARIKREKDEKEAARIQARVTRLFKYGCQFDGQVYSFFTVDYSFNTSPEQIKTASDEVFEGMCSGIQAAIDAENARLAEIERQRKEEEARLAKIAEEQEAERKRLAAIAEEQERREAEAKAELERKEAAIKAEQERRQAALRAEADRIAAEKQAIEDARIKAEEEKALQERIEKERIEAAEKAKKEEAARIQREAEEKAEQERLAKIEAERREALRPDKEKLTTLADAIDGLSFPVLSTKEGKDILTDTKTELFKVVKSLRKKANALVEAEEK